jgi:hypothetical protein
MIQGELLDASTNYRHKRPKMMQKQPIFMISCGIIPDSKQARPAVLPSTIVI